MFNSEVVVVLPADLHARPAGMLAKATVAFVSQISIEFGGKIVNPRGVLAVMALGATAGSTVTIRAEGQDANEATAALADLLRTSQ
jgi:phosphotransferase system HPr (HPr) family protein